jgi:hypothetical protein
MAANLGPTPDWVQANPAAIDRALQRALSLPSGGWYVLGPARRIASRPVRFTVDGADLVVWRDSRGRAMAGSDVCPHMGASLSQGRVQDGCVVCPWHGLVLGTSRHGSWRPLPAHDDGVLVWVRLGSEEEATPEPILPKRPDAYVDAVMRIDATCEPRDVIANRLDPWHGTHFHPYSFSRLRMLSGSDEDELRMEVTYRIVGRLGVPVVASFTCPEPRTIVMTILEGDGAGSVVETHATPLGPGRTAIVEATLASSERPGFRHALRAAPLLRPAIRWASHRLWVDDARYAERLYALRTGAAR